MRVRMQDLTFRYPRGGFRLDVPSLDLASGSVTAVIGPSGTGKTTLLHLAAGIAVPERGRVTLEDTDLTGLDDAARRAFRIAHVGAVFQEFELLEYLDVRDNILLPYRITPVLVPDAEVTQRAEVLAAEVGLGDKLRRAPSRLSHGEKQRVAICRALVTEPDLVLADEPTGNLDPAAKDRVLAILVDQATRRGATLVTVTHDHALLDRFGRVIDIEALSRAAGAVA